MTVSADVDGLRITVSFYNGIGRIWMKKRFAMAAMLILALLMITSCASYMSKDELITREAIVDVPGATKDELYVKASSWMVDTFESAPDVVEYTDKEAGIIKGKYTIITPVCTFKGVVTIELKDGKAKIMLRFYDVDKPSFSDNVYEADGQYYNDVNAETIQSFELAMKAQNEW